MNNELIGIISNEGELKGVIEDNSFNVIVQITESGPRGPQGKDGSDANVTYTNVVNALGYIPLSEDSLPDNLETTSGAQAKANQAEQNAKDYTDQEISSIDIPDSTWESIQNKPDTFAPSEHVHSIESVTGLQNELNSKETPAGAQAKADAAESNAKSYVDGKVLTDVPVNAKFTDTVYSHPSSHPANMITESSTRRFVSDTKISEWDSKETTTGSQDKANQAEQNAKNYTDSELSTHLADDVSQGELHGFRLNQDKKLEYFNGIEYVEVKGGGYPVNIVKNVSASAGDAKVELMWEDPDDVVVDGVTIAEWNHTKVMRKVGSYPLHEEDGELVVSNGVRNAYKDTPYSDVGLQNDTTYYYAMFPTTTEEIVTISEVSRVSATPSEQKIYGVEIDENNSNPETSVTYTDDAVGFTPARGNNGNFDWGSWENIIKDEFKIRPCVLRNLGGGNAGVNYYLDYDDYTKKADGSNSNLTGDDGDVMVEFGVPLWWKFTRIDNKLKIQLSAREFDGAVKHAFDIEEGYNQFSFYPLTLTQIIMLLMLKNRDTQTALGRGYVDGNSAYVNTGTSNNRPFMYGETTGKQQMKFLGMEDYWGNRRQWIDGCFYDASRNMMIGKANFNDTGSGYANNGVAMLANGSGYIDTVQGGNNTGFIPKSFGGSTTTHYSDYGAVHGGGLPSFGGHLSNGDGAGGFYLYSDTAASSTASFGGRLAALLGKKLYIGVYLGVTVGGKLRSVSGQASENNKTIGNFRTLAKANN